MARADYRGARGANVGDYFHELWSLKQILALLEHDSSLKTVTVEGILAKDEAGAPPRTWDGVDCALYYAGDTETDCPRIVLDQLKYSGSDPGRQWTIAELVRSTAKRANNSVIFRLAQAFKAVLDGRNGSSKGVTVRLVSNRPVDPHVLHILESIRKESGPAEDAEDTNTIVQASGLDKDSFRIFATVLDFESGVGSRFQLEERILKTLASWLDIDALPVFSELLRHVQQMMMPEAAGQAITRETILSWLGFSSWHALFPCPSEIKPIRNPVSRDVASRVVQDMLTGCQFLCLHGPAGCGKTTALQEVKALLPEGSEMLVFDCYGAGRYLDSNAFRHRPSETFLQLCNDLAARLHVPLLLTTRGKDLNYARSFSERLNRAAEVVGAQGSNALLVIAVDAADNSITAAQSVAPPEGCFVYEFVSLGGLANNVRLLVTARTGRLHELRLPERFTSVEIRGFSIGDTEANVRRVWKSAPKTWIDDFHHLSGGNPRVQSYALEAGDPAQALGRLQPHGKDVEQLFIERLQETMLKFGNKAALDDFAAALVVLPRPIPMEDLSAISGLSLEQVYDISADLAPMIRVRDESIGFADEDFERFLQCRAKDRIQSFRNRVAEWFMGRRNENSYAAANLAPALLRASRGREIIHLLEQEKEPTAIHDPLMCREIQIQRLRIAVQVSVEHQDLAEAVWTILLGAEALRTDAAIYHLVVANPDLAAAFMRESAERMILLDTQSLEHHGPLLFHLMLQEAMAGNGVMTRDYWRRLIA